MARRTRRPITRRRSPGQATAGRRSGQATAGKHATEAREEDRSTHPPEAENAQEELDHQDQSQAEGATRGQDTGGTLYIFHCVHTFFALFPIRDVARGHGIFATSLATFRLGWSERVEVC